MPLSRTQLVAAAVAILASAPAVSETVDVSFAPGKHFRNLSGTIRADADVEYRLRAREGQVMQVLFSRTRGSCYFNAYEPGNADSAVHIGSSAGNEFGASPTKAGTYRFLVYQMRATARRGESCDYRISFEITGAGEAGTK